MRTKKFNASSPSLGICYCSVKSQSSFWFLPSLSRSKSESDPPWSPRKPQWVWPHPWAPWSTLHLGPLFGEWEGLHCGGRSALWFPRARVLLSGAPDSWSVPSTEGSVDTKLWKSSAVCVGGRGQRRRLVQVLLIGEGFMIFTMCLVPCVCSETQTKDGKGELICF